MSQKIGGVLIPFAILDDDTLTLAEKILFSYFHAFQHNGERCWMSSEKLGKRLGISWRTAKRALSVLLKRRYIKRIKWKHDGKIVSAFECISLDWAKLAQDMRGRGHNVTDLGPFWPSGLGQKGTYNNNPIIKNKKASPDFEVSEKTKEFAERMGIAKEKLQ